MNPLHITAALLLAAVAMATPQGGAGTSAAKGKDAKKSAKGAQRAEFSVRDLRADSLRDFPGTCFGSTTFQFYRIGDSWPLTPFCGMATCLTDGVNLIERVRDCGLMPKENPKCKISNLEDRVKPFPACCPQFTCAEGVELEYPSREELEAMAQEARENQLRAAAAAQQLAAAQSQQGAQLGGQLGGAPGPVRG